jgi:hypothetical protein
MNFAEALRGSLQEFLVGASIEIRGNGSRITAISCFPGRFKAKAASRTPSVGGKLQRHAPHVRAA